MGIKKGTKHVERKDRKRNGSSNEWIELWRTDGKRTGARDKGRAIAVCVCVIYRPISCPQAGLEHLYLEG